MTRRQQRLFPRTARLRGREPTVDEFVGEWWDRHAESVCSHRDLVAAIPMLVRWILPHLGQVRVRALSADTLATYVDAITAAGAARETVDACIDLLDDMLMCAATWGVIPQSPPDDSDTVVWRCGRAGEVVPFPSRDSLPDLPDSA
jgi:hypothetical protein